MKSMRFDVSQFREDAGHFPRTELLLAVKSFDLQAIQKRYLDSRSRSKTGSVERRHPTQGGVVHIIVDNGKIAQNKVIATLTEPRGVELPNVLPTVDKKTGKTTAPGFNALKLLPGENDVPLAYWDKVKGNGAVKQWLATHLLKNNGEGVAKSIIASLDNLAPDVALRHIGKCENVKLLNDWKAGTKGRALRKTISERILEVVASQTGDAPSDTVPAPEAPPVSGGE